MAALSVCARRDGLRGSQ